MANAAASFEAMVKADREKRKREQLAQQMLGSRKPSAGAGSLATRKTANGQVTSLASRVGVTKRSSSAAPRPNIDGQWTHDLHEGGRRGSRPSSTTSFERGSRMVLGLQRELSTPNSSSSQANIRKQQIGPSMSIRGMATPASAGPHVVIASNFAPGTTAADIEAAMQPVGGDVRSCKLVSASPTVMAELIFENKDGADNAIATFNNQKADGRVLYVYMKSGGPTPGLHPLQNSARAPASRATQEVPAIAKQPEPAYEAPTIEQDVMEIDNDKPARRDDRPKRYDDRNGYRDDRRRDDSYQEGHSYYTDTKGRRDPPRSYGRRGLGLYSDAPRGDRRYRP